MLKKKIIIFLLIFKINENFSYGVSNDDMKGEWTAWSEWSSCIGECSYGHKTRIRTCVKSSNSNPDKRCFGMAEMQKICRIEKKCVVNGEWSEWSTFECDSKCGIGIKIRKRTCDNPPPSNSGLDCIGFSEETDYCSDFTRDDCLNDSEPLKFMPFFLKYLILKKLQFKAENYVESSNGRFECDDDLLNYFYKSFKNIQIEWLLNGNVLKKNSSFLVLEKGKKVTGIYLCTVKIPILKYRIVLDYFPLIVDKKILSDYRGQPTTIFANVLTLNSILRHLSLRINVVKNSKIVRNFSLNELPFDDHLRLTDYYLIEKIDDDSYDFILTDYNNPPKIRICTNRLTFK
ncbi:coadhesin, partial [Brachionus plicatilis]